MSERDCKVGGVGNTNECQLLNKKNENKKKKQIKKKNRIKI